MNDSTHLDINAGDDYGGDGALVFTSPNYAGPSLGTDAAVVMRLADRTVFDSSPGPIRPDLVAAGTVSQTGSLLSFALEIDGTATARLGDPVPDARGVVHYAATIIAVAINRTVWAGTVRVLRRIEMS